MTAINKMLSGGISDVIESLGGVVDRFVTTKQEKQEFTLELQSQLMQLEQQLEETYRTELESRTDIIKAEMAQGDLFTKRARPMIVYSGLAFTFIVHVFLPVVAYLTGTPAENMPHLNLPEQFWWAWGTVVGIYGAGRSVEKLGITNKITDLATGSGASKVKQTDKAVG